jgi:hypothetical protein
MVLNADFENFKTSTWPEFREWIPWQHVIPQHRYRGEVSWEPQKPFVLVFNNGAKVICKGLRDPNSLEPNMSGCGLVKHNVILPRCLEDRCICAYHYHKHGPLLWVYHDYQVLFEREIPKLLLCSRNWIKPPHRVLSR